MCDGGITMGRPIAFFEVVSVNHERPHAFYRKVFDWHVAGRLAIFTDPDGNQFGLWHD
jgi:predicted enzyme related to lactoylglutathione lyase